MYKTNFPGEIVNFCLKHVVSVNFGFLGTLFVHPVTRQICLLHGGIEVAPLAETLS